MTAIDFSKGNGLVPAVIQDYNTLQVLMLGFMNEEAYEKTKSEGRVTFFSRSKNCLWTKGEASGHYLFVKEITIDLNEIVPVVAAPHHVDNIRSAYQVAGTVVHEGLIGTCTNGRIEDLRVAAGILKGKKIKPGFQLNVIPASDRIYLQAINEGLISDLVESGANILTPSCGPCLGTGLGIPANGHTVISTANRNFAGRMGNKEASIYLASPATVASSAIAGVITAPPDTAWEKTYPFVSEQSKACRIGDGEIRKSGKVWNYTDVDNFNTDQMFAGKYTYNILSSDPESIIPRLFEDFDPLFVREAAKGDIIMAGENFGCGSSREHPSVGLAFLGIHAVVVKSVNRIFYRSSINQGLMLIVHREAVEAYRQGDDVEVNPEAGEIKVAGKVFRFEPLPASLRAIIEMKGLVNFIKQTN